MIYASQPMDSNSGVSAPDFDQDGSPAVVSAIGDKPSLRPGVRFVGKMSDVGFEDEQWLIEHEGRFIQTSELVYRVAERANGLNTLAEIAKQVTDITDWIVDAADVQHLITAKLVLLRLVSTTIAGDDSKSGEPAPSPLALNMRVRVLSPRLIGHATKLFQIFCNRPAVITVLLIAASVHWWLYRMHGVLGSIQDVIYTPGGMLVVFAAIFVGAIFHEFGHASVLRSQGGMVRSMGFGLYLMYPAFYTDVSDSYRLGRWARVRTDLGGIYFHLIFIIAIFAFFRLTGREFLLFPILLIDLEMLGQFIPVVRLDGYWLLADLSGIPDFFSMMVPFLRSFLPVTPQILEGERLPTLRWWVRAMFAVYMVGVIPLLTYVFILMLRVLPTVLVESWKAMRAQIDMLFQVSVRADFFVIVLLLIQIALIAVTAIGTVYLLWSVVKKPVVFGWKWARGDSRRRLVFAAAVSCFIAILAVFWVPRRAVSTLFRPRLNKAEALLDDARTATKHLKSLKADVDGSLGADHFTAKVLLKRPNLANIDINGSKWLGRVLMVSDGTILQTYFPDDNQLVKIGPGSKGENVQAYIIEEVDDFFRPERIAENGLLKYAGENTLNGMTYEVVTNEPKDTPGKKIQYYISKADKLIRRIVTTDADGRIEASTTLTHLQPNVKIDKLAFKWKAPATASPLQLPAGVNIAVPK